MPLTRREKKTLREMTKTYGGNKGKQVFYAMESKRRARRAKRRRSR